MAKRTAQPENTDTVTEDETKPAEPASDVIDPAAATLARDMTLLCDNCKGRLERAHAEDERNRNAVYPEGVTP